MFLQGVSLEMYFACMRQTFFRRPMLLTWFDHPAFLWTSLDRVTSPLCLRGKVRMVGLPATSYIFFFFFPFLAFSIHNVFFSPVRSHSVGYIGGRTVAQTDRTVPKRDEEFFEAPSRVEQHNRTEQNRTRRIAATDQYIGIWPMFCTWVAETEGRTSRRAMTHDRCLACSQVGGSYRSLFISPVGSATRSAMLCLSDCQFRRRSADRARWHG